MDSISMVYKLPYISNITFNFRRDKNLFICELLYAKRLWISRPLNRKKESKKDVCNKFLDYINNDSEYINNIFIRNNNFNVEKKHYVFLNGLSEKILQLIFTHKSVCGINNYESLEFLGDSVLGMIVSLKLFNENKTPGDMTIERSHIVNNKNLSDCFDKLEIESLVLSNCDITKKIKADVVEALIGGIFTEKGLEETKTFIEKYLY